MASDTEHARRGTLDGKRGTSLSLLMGLILVSGRVAAQTRSAEPTRETDALKETEPTQETTEASGPRPPELVEFVEAEYPSQALVEGRGASVTLRLTIDTEGRVTEAEVVPATGESGAEEESEGAGETEAKGVGEPPPREAEDATDELQAGFDAAARSAALRFVFRPAWVDGHAVAARILYRYDFRAPEPPLAEVPTLGGVAGRVLLPGNGLAPATGGTVRLFGAGGAFIDATIGADGRFSIEGLPAGRYQLQAQSGELLGAEMSVTIMAGEVVQPLLRLLPAEVPDAIEVTVQGDSVAQRLRESAQAVTVIETEQAKEQTADMGEVLARSQGVGVRRGGGLGSGTRFSLNGLTDDQIRFFVDGVPMEASGYPFGIANVPVNLVERAEVYRGVVPVRFGADALGGAVNLVTDDDVRSTHGSASYQLGSFGTQRGTASFRSMHEPTGIYTRFAGFLDQADNDYAVDVEVPDERGRLSPAPVNRFHDDYSAYGGNLEVGVADQPWARRLVARGFATRYDKALQHNVVMTVPYGDVEYGELNTGGTLRYENVFSSMVTVDALAGYSHGRTDFVDAGECVFDWFGECVRDRRQAGEIQTPPRDQRVWDDAWFGRGLVGVQLHPEHAVRLSLTPHYATRTGDERLQIDPSARDPLTAERDLFTMVTGLEYEANLFDDTLESVLFFKSYRQDVASEEPLPGGIFRRRDRDVNRFGAGNALRVRLTDSLYAKASYEYATRLPRPDEVFGDAVLVIDNLELEPETSHNANLGLTADVRATNSGDFRLDTNAFLRDAEQLIVLLGNDRVFSYQNVFGARSLGMEGSAGWTSPGGYLALDANVTYQSFRNTSSEGSFGDFEGDRIPNRPYWFANGSARLELRGLLLPRDEVSLVWSARYVHEFFRGWESVGLREFKQVVDSQLVQSLGLVYRLERGLNRLSLTGEVQNLTDARAFDFFGVQRPGRALYAKTSLEF